MINSAQLSELRGRVAITSDELTRFSEEQAAKDPTRGRAVTKSFVHCTRHSVRVNNV